MSENPRAGAALPTIELMNSVRSPEVVDLASSVSDSALDAIIDGGGFDGIPIVQWVVGLQRGARAVRDQLFLRKVFHFLSPLAEIPQAEREAFVAGLLESGETEHAGEAYLLWLERLNSMEKAPMLGRIFRAYVQQEITFDESVWFADMLDRAYLPLLRQIRHDMLTGYHLPDSDVVNAHLVSIGLVHLRATIDEVSQQQRRDVPARDVRLLKYVPTQGTAKFLWIIFDKKAPSRLGGYPLRG